MLRTVFDSRSVRAPERVEAWRAATAGALVRNEFSIAAAFHATLRTAAFGPAQVTALTYASMTSRRTPRLIRQADPEMYAVGLPATRRAPAVTTAMADLATGSGSWPAGAARLQAAFDRLDRACLGEAGLHLPPAPTAAPPPPEDEAAVIDLGGRTRDGYGIATAGGPAAAPAPDAAVPRRDRARFTEAQFGRGAPRTAVRLRGAAGATVPTGGCVAAAREQLGGSLQAWARLDYVPQLLADATLHAAATDPGYTAVLAGWRACMRGSAYAYPTPQAAVASCAASTPRERPAPPSAAARSPSRWRTAAARAAPTCPRPCCACEARTPPGCPPPTCGSFSRSPPSGSPRWPAPPASRRPPARRGRRVRHDGPRSTPPRCWMVI